MVKQNPVIPNINNSANIILYTLWVHKLYLLYSKNMLKCNLYYRPDMGWEPVWHRLWINKAELKQKISRNTSNLKVLLS